MNKDGGGTPMLEKVNLKKEMTKSEYKQHAEPLKKELTVLQQQIKTAKLPVIILFEGWGAAGKGSLITSLILNFDPRGFKVYSLSLIHIFLVKCKIGMYHFISKLLYDPNMISHHSPQGTNPTDW